MSRPNLSSRHADLIRASAISNQVAEARGYRTVTTPQSLARLGFADYQRRLPGLLVPVWGVSGRIETHQLRPDSPRADENGRIRKYETVAGARMVLDVHPLVRPMLADPTVALLVTEGARKADAATSARLPAVALLGVDCWRGTNEYGGRTALACWESIALNGRQVFVGFDSDAMTKAGVQRALARLAAFLESRGAVVQVLWLPASQTGGKVGVDDYLAAGHSIAELLSLVSGGPLGANVGPGAHVTELDLAGMVDSEPDPPAWVWHGYLERGTVAQLHGDGGLGKSLVAEGLAFSVIRGGDFLGWPCRRGNVLVIDAENPARLIHRRLAGFELTLPETKRLRYLRADAPALGSVDEAEDYLVDQIEQSGAVLVVLDSQRGLWGGDEKEQAEVRPWYMMLRRVAERTDVVILVIHHDNRAGNYSGSSDLNASVDTRLHLRRPKDYDESVPDTGERLLVHAKARATAEQPAVSLVIDWSDGRFSIKLAAGSVVAAGRLTPSQSRAVAFIRRTFGETEQRVPASLVAEHVGVTERTVRRWRDELASVRISYVDGQCWPTDEEPDNADMAECPDTADIPHVRDANPHESTESSAEGADTDTPDTEACPQGENPYEYRDCARTDTDTPTGWSAEGRAPTPEPPVVDDRAVLLVEQMAAVELPDGESDPAPCRWPSHRATDWRNQAGRLVCGVCHPRAGRAVESGSSGPSYDDPLMGDSEAVGS